ncbi:MAG: rubrerythrin [Candidatus Melainabacteria bacterium GWA2_34_9]|nr:MAG: rubrerythrin [Candidatus Melainabacteria bacterium GWA2_34_9]
MEKKSMKGTRTEHNLMAAFAGESQARNRYTFYASVAKKEGYNQIADIFLETAGNEKEHAEIYFKCLEERHPIEITETYPSAFGNTMDNLRAAAEGEHFEWETLYPGYAKVADEEGFPEAASAFRRVSLVETRHEARYKKLLANVENNKVFERETKVEWKCENCGYVHSATKAPEICPVCTHPKAYFELFAETY